MVKTSNRTRKRNEKKVKVGSRKHRKEMVNVRKDISAATRAAQMAKDLNMANERDLLLIKFNDERIWSKRNNKMAKKKRRSRALKRAAPALVSFKKVTGKSMPNPAAFNLIEFLS